MLKKKKNPHFFTGFIDQGTPDLPLVTVTNLIWLHWPPQGISCGVNILQFLSCSKNGQTWTQMTIFEWKTNFTLSAHVLNLYITISTLICNNQYHCATNLRKFEVIMFRPYFRIIILYYKMLLFLKHIDILDSFQFCSTPLLVYTTCSCLN